MILQLFKHTGERHQQRTTIHMIVKSMSNYIDQFPKFLNINFFFSQNSGEIWKSFQESEKVWRYVEFSVLENIMYPVEYGTTAFM